MRDGDGRSRTAEHGAVHRHRGTGQGGTRPRAEQRVPINHQIICPVPPVPPVRPRLLPPPAPPSASASVPAPTPTLTLTLISRHLEPKLRSPKPATRDDTLQMRMGQTQTWSHSSSSLPCCGIPGNTGECQGMLLLIRRTLTCLSLILTRPD